MTASIIQFPSRGGFIRRENAAYESATVAGERMACITPNSGQNNLARTIVIRYRETPSSHSLMAGILREARVTIRCAPLSAGAGACADLSNLCRVFTRDNGNLFLRALQAGKQTARGLFQAFKRFLCWFALVHGHTMNCGAYAWNEKSFPNPTTSLPRIK